MFASRRQFLSIHQPSLEPIDTKKDTNFTSESKPPVYNSNNPNKIVSSFPTRTTQPRIFDVAHSFSNSNKCILIPNHQKYTSQTSHLKHGTSQKASSTLVPLSQTTSKNSLSPTFNSTPLFSAPDSHSSDSSQISKDFISGSDENNQLPSSDFAENSVSTTSENLESNAFENTDIQQPTPSVFTEDKSETLDENSSDNQSTETSTIKELTSELEKSNSDENIQSQTSCSKNSTSFDEDIRQKLEICSQICDFTLQKSHMHEKELKSHTLFELVDLFEHSSHIQNISQDLQKDIFQMIEVNVFNPNRIRKVTISDYSFTFLEPSWSHLFYCYQIFNKFLRLFPNSALVNKELMKRILLLTELPDNNERIQLVSLLRTYYDTHQNERILILKSVESLFIDLRDDQVSHFCAMPLLQLSAYMFTRSRQEYSEYFNRLIKHSIIPIIGLKFLPFYQQSLKNFISVVLTAYPSMALELLRGIELKWPITNGTKQHQILDILILIFSKMTQEAFKPISKRVFKFLADCVLSNHSKTVEATLDIWITADEKNWVGINSRVAIKEMYENVSTISEKHWNSQISTKANLVLAAMNKLNKNSLQKIKLYYKQLKSQKFREKPPNTTQKTWNLITQTASQMGADIDLNEKINQLRELFHNEKRPTLEVSRFIPAKKKDIEEAKKIAKQQ